MEKSVNPPPYGPSVPPHPPQGPVPIVSTGNIPATVVAGGATQYGPNSQNTVCPHCHSQIITRVDAETTSKTHLIAVLLCVCACWCCVCLPYCMDSCKSRNHYCPSCGAFLGAYKG